MPPSGYLLSAIRSSLFAIRQLPIALGSGFGDKESYEVCLKLRSCKVSFNFTDLQTLPDFETFLTHNS